LNGSFAYRALNWAHSVRQFQQLLLRELRSPVRVPLAKKLWLWSRGFLSEDWVLYDLRRNKLSDYVSDYARFIRTMRINGRFRPALDNKVVFSGILRSLGADVPEYYCLVSRGSLTPIGNKYDMTSIDAVVDACRAEHRLIVKPFSGGSGVNIAVMSATNGKLYVNEVEASRDDLKALLESMPEAVISEFVQQHEYASTIYPHTANSIRILTMWDYERDEPFIALAAQRFGSHTTIPVDNWTRGGLIAQVDLETGVLGKGATYPRGSKMDWHEFHPDTGARIEGVLVPRWEYITSRVLELAGEMPFLPYVGWDIVVTEDGFTVTEGNSYTDVHGLQILAPLLIDPRVRSFYRHHGVL